MHLRVRHRIRFPAVFLAPLLLVFAIPPVDAAAPELAAHTALYKLTMSKANSDDVVAASGTMTYEVQDACEGWAVQQRLDMKVTNRDGQDVQMVSDYATWEAKNGLKLRFRMRQTTETAVTEITSGEASLQAVGKPGEIHYVEPKEATMPLQGGTVFPMAHTAKLIAGAEEGQKFMSIPLFDGTSANGGQETSVIVTKWGDTTAAPYPELDKLPNGRVHVAFFDHGSQAPDYEVSMRYWENGVADDLLMDFGDFVMSAKLSSFKLEPPHHC
jgi:hypothetical protein